MYESEILIFEAVDRHLSDLDKNQSLPNLIKLIQNHNDQLKNTKEKYTTQKEHLDKMNQLRRYFDEYIKKQPKLYSNQKNKYTER